MFNLLILNFLFFTHTKPSKIEIRMTAFKNVARASALSRHALGRFNTPEEAARFIGFLTRLGHISGQVFQLDSRA